jgi:hypothetical protein
MPLAARPPEFGEQAEAEFGFGKDEIADLRQRKVDSVRSGIEDRAATRRFIRARK